MCSGQVKHGFSALLCLRCLSHEVPKTVDVDFCSDTVSICQRQVLVETFAAVRRSSELQPREGLGRTWFDTVSGLIRVENSANSILNVQLRGVFGPLKLYNGCTF